MRTLLRAALFGLALAILLGVVAGILWGQLGEP